MSFLLNCLKPDAIMMLFITVISLVGYGFPGFQGRGEGNNGFGWWIWLIIGILALVSWVMLVVS